TATTAIGLLSLWFSDLAPIRLFGLFSAIGVGVALSLQLVLLPSLLAIWPAHANRAALNANDASPDATEHLSPGWKWLCQLVVRRHAPVAALCLAVLAVSGLGLLRVQTSIQVMRLFSPDTPIIASYGWLEEHLGALVPLEIVIRFDASND